MAMVRFDVIYEPKGPAKEYSAWACNIVKSGQRGDGPKSCSHGCLYCYNPPGTTEGPILKDNIIERLKTDLKKLKEIIKPGEKLEFTFVGDLHDPKIPAGVARACLLACKDANIPFQVLTKNGPVAKDNFDLYGAEDLFGVTLTCDNDTDSAKWEPGASLWSDRIDALKTAHECGINTWVSFEPVVDPKQTLHLIELVAPFADKIKVGKMNSKNNQPWHCTEIKDIGQNTDWAAFGKDAIKLLKSLGKEFYIKDDLRKFLTEEVAPIVTNSQDLRKAALDYAKRGWRVIPLYEIREDGSCACGRPDCDGNSKGKHPRLTEWQKKASDDTKKITHWWGTFPHANVGVMCGQDTGFMVVDVDGPTGEDSLKGRDWPKTQKVKTGRGFHYHFKWPKLEFALKNNAGILPGVDIKVGKGQAVMPPSVHYNGTKYEWEVSPDECELADAPAWFVEILKEKFAPKKRLEENITKLENTKKAAQNNRYWQAALEKEVGNVAMANEGTRNDQLNKSAYVLAGIVAAHHLDDYEVRSQLERAARRAGLNETEIERTLSSALGAGKSHPRDDPKSNITVKFRKREEQPEPEKKKRIYCLNNRGNVERLLDLHDKDLKYVREYKDWIHWTGKNWQRDETAPFSSLDDVVASLYEETKTCQEDDKRKKLAGFAALCGNHATYAATVALASKNPEFSVSVLEMDADDCKINLQNGVLNLKDFQLLEHDSKYNLMKITKYAFDIKATCPRWDQFMIEIFEGKTELIEYVQRAVGYSLTGEMTEKCFFFLYGAEGDNGKSKFLEILRELLGEYAKNADIATFLTSKNEKVRDDLAALYGARVITTAEPEEGSRFAMAVIKPWTGGDPQTCRELYGKIFTYQPKGKLWLAANNKPSIYERTNAAWGRIQLIPFNKTFKKEDQDGHLSEKLKKELPGILNWALKGLMDYRTLGGLYQPAIIKEAVESYRRENDSVRVFVEEVCTIESNASMDGPQIYTSYKDFCLNSGLRPLGLGKFNAAMLETCVLKGITRDKRASGFVWYGIRAPASYYHEKRNYD
jgi:putative DNA primase/helicase